MRLLVGTLYTGENEFEACVAAIERQTHRDFEHFIIRDLPKAEAHDQLYGTFMTQANEFDLFIKVDADMVITDDRLFERICERFRHAPAMRNLQIAVQDFFTDQLVGYLHAYRSDVTWSMREGHAFTDINDLSLEEKVADWSELAPAANHCPDPSPFQAFHFGMHKGVKIVEGMRLRWYGPARFHVENVERTWAHFQRNPDRRLGLACVGAESAIAQECDARSIDHGSEVAARLFEQVAVHDVDQLRRTVIKMRRRRTRGLPAYWWFEIAYHGFWAALGRNLFRDRWTQALIGHLYRIIGRQPRQHQPGHRAE